MALKLLGFRRTVKALRHDHEARPKPVPERSTDHESLFALVMRGKAEQWVVRAGAPRMQAYRAPSASVAGRYPTLVRTNAAAYDTDITRDFVENCQ